MLFTSSLFQKCCFPGDPVFIDDDTCWHFAAVLQYEIPPHLQQALILSINSWHKPWVFSLISLLLLPTMKLMIPALASFDTRDLHFHCHLSLFQCTSGEHPVPMWPTLSSKGHIPLISYKCLPKAELTALCNTLLGFQLLLQKCEAFPWDCVTSAVPFMSQVPYSIWDGSKCPHMGSQLL